MKSTVSLLAVLAVMVSGTIALSQDGKAAIKEAMKVCMKGGLCKKVAGGKASDAEKQKLHDLFVAMSKAKPPKGDAESWKEKTGALVAAAKAAVDGKDAGGDLKKAANCKNCHKVHK